MTERLDELRLSAWRTFITAHARVIDRINRDLTAADRIPLHWYDVLIELYEEPAQKLRLSELAQRVVLSKSGLTRLVDRLAQEGYLRREPTPGDRRGAFAAITDKGKKAMKRAWPIYARGIARYFGRHLSDGEARVLRASFERMLDALRPGPAVW